MVLNSYIVVRKCIRDMHLRQCTTNTYRTSVAILAQASFSLNAHAWPCRCSLSLMLSLAACLQSASWDDVDDVDAGGDYGRVQVRCVGGRLDDVAVLWVRSQAVTPVAWTSLASTCHAILPHIALFVTLGSGAALSSLVRLLGFIMLLSGWISSSWSPSSCSCLALSQWCCCLSPWWPLWV